MATDTFRNPVEFTSGVTFKSTMTIDTGTLKNSHWSDSSSDRLASTKSIQQQQVLAYQVDKTTTVASQTTMFWGAPFAGTLVAFHVYPHTAPTGGDKQFTVDLQRAADGSTTFATMLSSAETVDNTSVDGTRQDATLSSTTVAAGDKFQCVVTASGSTGTQGLGLIVMAVFDMDPA